MGKQSEERPGSVTDDLCGDADNGAAPEAALTFELMGRNSGNPNCAAPDCNLYPYYGVAPHICFYKRGDEFSIGQSIGLPPSQWPDNFVPDLEPGETAETVAYPNACGVYYCPACKHGMPVADEAAALEAHPEARSTGSAQS
jgi:hypothetical protein